MVRNRRLALSKKMCKNIYYMLCYATEELEHMVVGDISFEDVVGVNDLLAILLANALDIWSIHSPLRDYTKDIICTDKVRGSVDIIKSYRSGSIANGKLYCSLNRLGIDTQYNQIIKLAIKCITNAVSGINKTTYGKLAGHLMSLSKVSDISPQVYKEIRINFKELPIHYRPVIAASKIVLDNILASDEESLDNGQTILFKLEDDKRYQNIFERFVRNFYRVEYDARVDRPVYKEYTRDGSVVTRKRIPDLVLEKNNRGLIIDTKWYTQFNNDNGNQDQMKTYIMEYMRRKDCDRLTGVILYANNGKRIRNDEFFPVKSDKGFESEMYRRVIDLNLDFEDIKKYLIELANEFLQSAVDGVK